MKTSDLKSFHYLESGEITYSTLDTLKSQKVLDPGVYKIHYEGHPHYRVFLNKDSDTESVKLFEFPDKKQLDDLFTSFFNPKVRDQFKNLGFNHKTGVLLYGKEGTGKSTILKYYYHHAIKNHDALVFQITNDFGLAQIWEMISNIRSIQDNPIIILMEEFDVYIDNKWESYLKTALDGYMALDNCIVMATTNYLEKIPAALSQRQSRFKYTLKVEGIQCLNSIYNIMHPMITNLLSDTDIRKLAKDYQGKTLDEIKQICVDKIMSIDTYTKESKIGFNLFGSKH